MGKKFEIPLGVGTGTVGSATLVVTVLLVRKNCTFYINQIFLFWDRHEERIDYFWAKRSRRCFILRLSLFMLVRYRYLFNNKFNILFRMRNTMNITRLSCSGRKFRSFLTLRQEFLIIIEKLSLI